MSQVSELRREVKRLAKDAGLKLSYWQTHSQSGERVQYTTYGVWDAEERRPKYARNCLFTSTFTGYVDMRETNRSSEYRALVEIKEWIEEYIEQGEPKDDMEEFETALKDKVDHVTNISRYNSMFEEQYDHISGTYEIPNINDGMSLNERLLMVDEGKKELLQEALPDNPNLSYRREKAIRCPLCNAFVAPAYEDEYGDLEIANTPTHYLPYEDDDYADLAESMDEDDVCKGSQQLGYVVYTDAE